MTPDMPLYQLRQFDDDGKKSEGLGPAFDSAAKLGAHLGWLGERVRVRRVEGEDTYELERHELDEFEKAVERSGGGHVYLLEILDDGVAVFLQLFSPPALPPFTEEDVDPADREWLFGDLEPDDPPKAEPSQGD